MTISSTFRVGAELPGLVCGHALDLPGGEAVCAAPPVLYAWIADDPANSDGAGKLLCACEKHRNTLARWAVSVR